MKTNRFSIELLLLIVLTAGCMSTVPSPCTFSSAPIPPTIRPTTPPSIGPSVSLLPTPTLSAPKPTPAVILPPTRSPQAQAAVEAAREYLAEHLEVDRGQVGLVYAEPGEWPDTSLGCPEPGKIYAQVLTPGYRVVLQVGNRQYELHTERYGKQVVFCRGPVPGERIPLNRARSKEEVIALARAHLADRLGVPLEVVKVVSVEEEGWEDDALGCPQPPGNLPDRAYPGPIPGYRIVLTAEGVQYEYHSGRVWLIFCGIRRG